MKIARSCSQQTLVSLQQLPSFSAQLLSTPIQSCFLSSRSISHLDLITVPLSCSFPVSLHVTDSRSLSLFFLCVCVSVCLFVCIHLSLHAIQILTNVMCTCNMILLPATVVFCVGKIDFILKIDVSLSNFLSVWMEIICGSWTLLLFG